jgi:adenosine deaminase
MLDPSLELADLHIHVGAAVAPHILWSIAHDQGFKLPVQTYWEFATWSPPAGQGVVAGGYLRICTMDGEDSVVAGRDRALGLRDHRQGVPSSGVSLIELRFNPMKRNLGGERDLDHIIHAALRGMDRACLEYGVRAG